MTGHAVLSDRSQWRDLVEGLAHQQLELYAREPLELISHANREASALDGYRGRQVLELLQNADDAAEAEEGGAFEIHITRDALIAANTGAPFSERGIKSLIISDASPKQLAQNRFIGCKGLGFRSVLTWTRAPLVISGSARVSFDIAAAEGTLRGLAASHPELEAELARYKDRFGRLPIPLMRFPAWVDDALYARSGVSHFFDDGFDTVVALPFVDGPNGDRAHEDALSQVRALSPDTLLFCRNLNRVRFTGDHVATWELLRENLGQDRERIVINDGSDTRLWTVHRRTGQIPESAVPPDTTLSRDFEIAVAVPDTTSSGDGNRLCVFFPTHERLPIALRLHATLELTENRNRLITHDANKHVLAELATLLAIVIEDQATQQGGRRAVALMDGLQDADPDLAELGFVQCAIDAISTRNVFPRLAGDVAHAAHTRKAPDELWTSLLLPPHFPEVLESGVAKYAALLSLFGIAWYDTDELTSRLQQQLRLMQRNEAGELVGRLLARGRLSGVQVGDLLLDVDGNILGASTQAFFHPTSDSAQLRVPPWAQSVRFIDHAFQRGLMETSGAGSLRALSDRVRQHGGKVDEYRIDTVTRVLISDLGRGLAEDDDRRRERWCELLLWLFRNAKEGFEQLSRLPIRVITTRGSLKPAQDVYLGSSYPHGRLLSRLYGSFGIDEFTAPPGMLGFTGIEIHAVEAFLKAIGVKDAPALNRPPSGALRRRFTETTLDAQSYPLAVRQKLCEDANAVRAHCRDYDINNLLIPDRLDKALTDADPAALVAYLLSDGAPLVSNERSDTASFCARLGREQYSREEPGVQVPNPVLWLLRETPWVPCEDGVRRRPREVILSDVGARLFHGVFWKHAIDSSDPLLRERGGTEAITGLLMRLGAVASLEDISDDSLYGLLLRLPESDPEGRTAPSIYRTLVDTSRTPHDTKASCRFKERGHVWTKSASGGRYVTVSDARYNSALTLPKAVERELALIDIPRRKNTTVIEAIFGVRTLQSSEVRLEVDLDNTEFDPSSEPANAALRRSLPYVYALRLHKRADDDGRERSRLNRLKLRVCRHVHVAVHLPQDEQAMKLTEQGGRIAVGTDLYVVGQYAPNTPTTDRFWLWVASLIAEVLGSDVAADIALVLRCTHTEEMADTVRDLVGDEAEEKLVEARRRMEEPLPPAPPASYPIQSPSAAPHDTDDDGVDDDAQGSASGDKSASDDGSEDQSDGPHEFTVQPGTAPAGGGTKRRKLVVSGSGGGHAGGGLGPVATEDVTFGVVEAFERLATPPRVTIDVSHVRGAEGLGCDLVSVASEELKARILERGTLEDSEILRYIEVKGRNVKTGLVELTENELDRAEQARDRYFVYRVFVDVSRPGHFEIAVLRDPTMSNAVRQVLRLDLSAGSGAEWFNLEEVVVDDRRGAKA